MSAPPTATVVICTHNRGAYVAQATEAAHREASACGGDVLIVDNASTDDTPTLLAALSARLPGLRVVAEPALGLSRARNRGLVTARGDVVVYLDDDAVPRPGWLRALLAPFGGSMVGCVGGRVRLAFETPPPPWLTAPLHAPLAGYDQGDEPRRLDRARSETLPYGCNIAFRAAPVRALGGFSPDVGPRGRSQLVHDETDLCWRLHAAGYEIHYAPEAIVDHHIPAGRLTPEWFLRRFFQQGRSGAVFHLRTRGLHAALGTLRWHYRPDLTLRRRWQGGGAVDPEAFYAECRRREAWGYLLGVLRILPRLPRLRADPPLLAEGPAAAS